MDWISFKDRKPKKDEKIIVFDVSIHRWANRVWFEEWDMGNYCSSQYHERYWIPMPTMPKDRRDPLDTDIIADESYQEDETQEGTLWSRELNIKGVGGWPEIEVRFLIKRNDGVFVWRLSDLK